MGELTKQRFRRKIEYTKKQANCKDSQKFLEIRLKRYTDILEIFNLFTFRNIHNFSINLKLDIRNSYCTAGAIKNESPCENCVFKKNESCTAKDFTIDEQLKKIFIE